MHLNHLSSTLYIDYSRKNYICLRNIVSTICSSVRLFYHEQHDGSNMWYKMYEFSSELYANQLCNLWINWVGIWVDESIEILVLPNVIGDKINQSHSLQEKSFFATNHLRLTSKLVASSFGTNFEVGCKKVFFL